MKTPVTLSLFPNIQKTFYVRPGVNDPIVRMLMTGHISTSRSSFGKPTSVAGQRHIVVDQLIEMSGAGPVILTSPYIFASVCRLVLHQLLASMQLLCSLFSPGRDYGRIHTKVELSDRE